MLIARATSEVARLVAADALLGIPYTAEELEDQDTENETILATPAPTGPRRAQRASAPRKALANRPPVAEQPSRPEDTPDLDEPPSDIEPKTIPEDVTPDDVAEPDPEPDEADVQAQESVTQAQLRMLHALLTDADIIERDDRLAHVSAVIGREVGSSSDLTIAEASAVIDNLRASQARREP
jgi:hypothetical protein